MVFNFLINYYLEIQGVLISSIGNKNRVVIFNVPLVRAQVVFGKHLSLENSFPREMQFHFDQAEES